MAQEVKQERVVEDGVIIVNGEFGEAEVMVRRAPTNGGRIEFYKLERMGFGDIKPFLSAIAEKELPKM